MKKIILFLIVGLLGATIARVAAQEVPRTPQTGDLVDGPPELPMPTIDDLAYDQAEHPNTSLSDSPSSTIEPIPTGDLQAGLQPHIAGEEFSFLQCDPALLESTGTWLRRGFWFTEVDAVILNRDFSRNGVGLMAQATHINSETDFSGPFRDPFGGVFRNTLAINGSRPGAEGVPRVKLGRFLFRDHKNRDHTAEFIVYGGAEWSQNESLEVSPLNTAGTNSLFVPVFQDGGNVSFTGATRSQFQYDSRFNSFEVNYHVKARMRKDRMELEPSGHWVRRAQPSISRSILAGIRYVDLNEDFDWDAFGIADFDNDGAVESGNYRIRVDNDMIGTQLGFSWIFETARWSAGVQGKSGMYLNRIDLNSNFIVTGGLTQGAANLDEYNLSFVGETAGIAKWHLRPNLSLRASIEMLFISAVAMAGDQIDFIPSGTAAISQGGDSLYLGGSMGFESYW